jgi:nucleotide-binding universal stress UspA family protein
VSRKRPISLGEATEFRKPLLGYDGSPAADRALGAAIEVASASHGRLTIVSAVVHIPYLAYTGAAPEAVAEVRRSFLEDAESVLCRAVERLPRGIPVTKIVSSQPIERALLHEALAGNHDLVIVGSRGRGRIGSLVFGSVARTLLRRSPLPVLIARPTPDDAPVAEQGSAQIAAMTPRQV